MELKLRSFYLYKIIIIVIIIMIIIRVSDVVQFNYNGVNLYHINISHQKLTINYQFIVLKLKNIFQNILFKTSNFKNTHIINL